MRNITTRLLEIQDVIEGEILELHDYLEDINRLEEFGKIVFLDKEDFIGIFTKSLDSLDKGNALLKKATEQIRP